MCSVNLFSQTSKNTSVSGEILTVSGKALEGVNVILEGENRGVVTNSTGFYSIKNISSGKHILKVSFLGFKTIQKEINIQKGEKLTLNFKLEDAPFEMGSVKLEGKSAIRKINEQSYAVTSVSAKEFYNTTSDAKQVLNRVPGVRILQDGGLGSDLDFSLNGFSGDQVKFFLNGIPMDNFGSSFNLASIPVNSIERIDVYKGVVPVWLGTDALGGAVNIITNQKIDFLDASYSVGSFNTHRASVNGSFVKKNGFTVRGNLNYNYSDNDYDVIADIRDYNGTVVEKGVEVRRFHDRYRSLTANFETGWVNTSFADQLLVGIIASGDDNQIQNGQTMNLPYGGVLRESTSFIPTLKYIKRDLFLEGVDVSLNSAYSIIEQKTIDTLTGKKFNWYGEILTPAENEIPSETDAESGEKRLLTFDNTEFSTQFNASYLFNNQHSVVLNYSLQNFKRESADEINPDRLRYQFSSKVNKNISGLAYKFDYNKKWSTTVFGKAYFLKLQSFNEELEGSSTANKDNYGYGIASSYFIFPSLQLKASFERAFRLPTPTEILGDGLNTQPNLGLKPEESNNYNVGLNYNKSFDTIHQLSLEGNFIYRDSKNLIYETVQGIESTSRNLNKARTIGVEGSVNYSWKELFNIGANVTYQNITDQADKIYSEFSGYQENFLKGARVPNKPYLFGNATAGLRFKDVGVENSQLQFTYRYNYVEEFFFSWARFGNRDNKAIIPQQSSHDLELVYSFQQNKYNIGIECRNLTDAVLYDKFRLQKPGRAFYVKFRYAIN